MRTAWTFFLASVAALAVAGCGGDGRESPARARGPAGSHSDLAVEGMDLSPANRYYREANRLYMKGGVGVPERERRRNLSLAVKRYRQARAIYAKALERHPKNMRLESRVREIDMSIDGCRRMMNLNLTKGLRYSP